jgi:aspartate-semialdehyde dehydrogenase
LVKAKPVAAVVGSNSLLGRELRDVLSRSQFQIKLIGADEVEAGTLTEEGGEPLVITALDQDNLAAARVVFLAGSPESSGKALEIVSKLRPRPVVVDLTYALEDRPTAHLRAPVVEPAGTLLPPGSEHVVAHPAAILLALFLVRLGQAGTIRRAIAHVFEPASERGQRGIDELHRQTANVLTFQKLPKAVYDEQAAFNLLARYGAEAPLSMENIETRVERHLATLLAMNAGVQMPSIRLIQAPVFHGHSVSLWVEFEVNPGVPALEQTLASVYIDVRGADVEAPNVVGMAGQSGIAVGAIATDRNDARATWFWVAADNLRIAAENAVEVALPLAGPPEAGAHQ